MHKKFKLLALSIICSMLSSNPILAMEGAGLGDIDGEIPAADPNIQENNPNLNEDFSRIPPSPKPTRSDLENEYIKKKIESLEVQNSAQLIINMHAQETFWQHIRRPQTIMSLGLALLTSPLAYKFIQELLADGPSPQQKRANEISMELNELTLAQKKLHFKRDNQQAQIEEAMQMLALKEAALGTQEKQTKLEKEEAKLQLVNILSSLAKRKVDGQELTDKELEQHKLCCQMLGVLSLAKSDEPDTQKEDSKASIEKKAIPAAT